jgi:hypothetical protein
VHADCHSHLSQLSATQEKQTNKAAAVAVAGIWYVLKHGSWDVSGMLARSDLLSQKL